MRRVLFDENLPRLLGRDLRNCDVRTVPQAGWVGLQNGELLSRAEALFDVLVTADRGFPHQHRITLR